MAKHTKPIVHWIWVVLLGLCSMSPIAIHAQSFDEDYFDADYPQLSNTFSYIYGDYMLAYDRVFDKEAIPYWWAVGLSTAALIAVDDKLVSASEKLGRKWGIQSKDNTRTFISFQGIDILRLPTDLGSTLYFLGDGWTHASIAAGFLAAGAWSDDDKTFSVGAQLVEGMVTATIATQTLKHISGRETPNQSTAPAGRWDFFPSQTAYFDNVAKYDAFPSGHLAVGSMTLTVLHKNYPDNPYIMPVGVTLLSLLSFQMMNNGVHWASDYPLAIALGYTFGNIAFERGKYALDKHELANQAQWTPLVSRYGLGLAVQYSF